MHEYQMHEKLKVWRLHCRNTRGKATTILIVAQAAFIFLFAFTTDYAAVANARDDSDTEEHEPHLNQYYPCKKDIPHHINRKTPVKKP